MKKNPTLPHAATELALLETVDWSAMSVSAGDPSRIPGLIRGEPHASAAELRAILLNGGVTKASVHAASFLWTRIGDRLDADVSPWVHLLVDMAVGTDLSFLEEGFDWAAPATKAKFGRLQRPLVEQMRSGPVEALGASTIMENRVAAAYLLAFSGHPDARALLTVLLEDPEPTVRATARLSSHVRDPAAAVTPAGSDPLERIAKAVVDAGRGEADVRDLVAGVVAGPWPRSAMPWNDGMLWLLCASALEGKPELPPALTKLLQDAQGKTKGQALEMLHRAVFGGLEGRAKDAVLRSELSDAQVECLEGLRSANMGGLTAYGLPGTPEGLGLLLDGEHPLATETTVQGKTLPLWKWLESVVTKRISQEELLQGLVDSVAPDVAHAALCDAFRMSPGSVAVPWPGLCAGVAKWAAGDAKASAEALLADLQAQRVRWLVQTMDLALIPLASGTLTATQREFVDGVLGQYPRSISEDLKAVL